MVLYPWEVAFIGFLDFIILKKIKIKNKVLKEKNPEIEKWTKNHGIIIPYWDPDGKLRDFKPDFLIEKKDGSKERVEIKGKHLLPQFKRKMSAAQEWCKARKMTFRVISKY